MKRYPGSLVGWIFFFWGIAGHADQAPVIFLHGMGVDPAAYEQPYLYKLFKETGHRLLVAHTLTSGTLPERAAVLNSEVERLAPGDGPVHLMAHSMGGLDARLAIVSYGLGSRVRSLTMIATPNHGSPIADLVTGDGHFPPGTGSAGMLDALMGLFGRDPDSVRSLTTTYLEEEFNPNVPDDPRVQYYSMVFSIPKPAHEYTSHNGLLVAFKLMDWLGYDENDGLVPVESAEWGEVIYNGPCDHKAETMDQPFPGCDHRDVFRMALENLNQEFR
jgi:triacylglycerol lipase